MNSKYTPLIIKLIYRIDNDRRLAYQSLIFVIFICRSYYRCTYRHIQNCWVTKQVQRSDEDPTIFEITYRGAHTCNLAANNNSVASPEKKELKQKNNQNNNQMQQPNEMLMNFRANLRVNTTDDSENKDKISPSFSFPSTLTYIEGENQYFPTSTYIDEDLLGTYSPSFISPATSESNYFSVSCHMNSLGGAHNLQQSESDLTDLISATNSPIGGLDFSIDPTELDANFNFSRSGFFK